MPGAETSRVLRATALVGGSSLLNIAVGVLRTKAMALLLGPSGVGLIALYGSIVDLMQSIAGMGIQNSGVRQIAAAVGSSDIDRIRRTGAVLRRTALGLGVVGGLGLIMLAGPVSRLTFGSSSETRAVALLSVAVLCRELAAGQTALIQGMRRIGELARLNVLSALSAALVSIPIVYFWGRRGVVLSIVCAAGASLAVAAWYGRRVKLRNVRMSVGDFRRDAGQLLSLGIAFMATGFLTMGAAYVIRILVLRRVGVEAAGLYQAAWALGGLYVGFILQAMGADFYPRLTGVATDRKVANEMVNEQARISLLLAGPGVIATLTLAPMVITFFYSPEFAQAIRILRWVCLGMTLRVVAWPLGFIIVANGMQNVMIGTEVAAAIVHVGLAWILLRAIGLEGAGAAFFGLYVWHGVLIYAIVRRVTAFRWSPENLKLGLMFLPTTGVVFLGFYLLPPAAAVTLGLIATAVAAIYSARALLMLVPAESAPPLIRSWLPRLGVPTGAANA